MRCGAHGPAHVLRRRKHNNYIMSSARIANEWGNGMIQSKCPFICRHRHEHLKLQSVDVALFVRVAVLLTNAHTCLKQSSTGLYFDCVAPTLREYFA